MTAPIATDSLADQIANLTFVPNPKQFKSRAKKITTLLTWPSELSHKKGHSSYLPAQPGRDCWAQSVSQSGWFSHSAECRHSDSGLRWQAGKSRHLSLRSPRIWHLWNKIRHKLRRQVRYDCTVEFKLEVDDNKTKQGASFLFCFLWTQTSWCKTEHATFNFNFLRLIQAGGATCACQCTLRRLQHHGQLHSHVPIPHREYSLK